MLEVESPGKSKPTFKVLLEMRGEMAEISLQHLMENDFVYVSGRLNSYTKVDSSGRDMLFYKVIVKEFNYVKHNNQCRTFQKPEALKLKSVSTSSALDSQMVETVRLHLWQVFFASPHEWWDNRGRKLYPSSPDFKHKDTGERLWIMPNDPPWVTKQLQLLDSKITERGQGGLVSVGFWILHVVSSPSQGSVAEGHCGRRTEEWTFWSLNADLTEVSIPRLQYIGEITHDFGLLTAKISAGAESQSLLWLQTSKKIEDPGSLQIEKRGCKRCLVAVSIGDRRPVVASRGPTGSVGQYHFSGTQRRWALLNRHRRKNREFGFDHYCRLSEDPGSPHQRRGKTIVTLTLPE
ncbi:hypothetical protein MRB53_017154 [Persea americana]|uniref:Uncharacterized protein n=1 Tax=Persea americana TaxID=3435 RepID=A0ACC2M489_PERAE|nr:hypothetical protein MRB53_017154 [Persea americana]